MTSKINVRILNEYYMYLLCIFILTIIVILFFFRINWFFLVWICMQINIITFNFIPKILDINLLINYYIITNTSVIGHQSKCIPLQQILLQTQQLVLHQQMGHKSYPIILYYGQMREALWTREIGRASV